MENTGFIQVQVDNALKKDADELFRNLGMDTQTAIRIFLKQSVSLHGMPFPVVVPDTFYSKENMDRIRQAVQKDSIVTKTLQELEDMADE